jgi:hypothetical protein
VGALETLDVEKLGAGSGTDGVESRSESALELVGSHGRRLRRRTVGRGLRVPVHIHSRMAQGDVLDGSLPRVYAPLVDARHRTSTFSTAPAMAFAVGALVMDLTVLVLPLHDGSSVVSLLLGDGFSFRVEVAYLLTLFAQSVAILVGLLLLRRGRATLASGVFVGLLVIIGLHVISSVLTSIFGWVWQIVVVLGLQTMECALLFLAARAARQQGT